MVVGVVLVVVVVMVRGGSMYGYLGIDQGALSFG